MAGLYDIGVNPQGQRLDTCTIITTTPNTMMAEIHDRMPVILRPEDESGWLQLDNQDIPALMKLLRPYDSAHVKAYPVGPAVGQVKK